ncbi:multiubiquitin domain-containing protein [Microcoleus sp. B7-D4]|uniref:multiubiquitin domain-containing protein n=1 Tax=Microcoleus sp. B7-D4 TaxID=2818696 RepID=UPI002FD70C8B
MSNLEGQGSEAGRPQFSVKIDDQTFTLANPAPTGRELLALVGRDPDDFFLVFLVPGEPDQIVEIDESFDLSGPGTEKLVLVSRARRFAIQIDETTHTVLGPFVSGAKILELAGKNADTHFVTQIIVGEDDIVIGPENQVDITKPGRERFTTVAKPDKPCLLDIEGTIHPWTKDTITTEEILELGGWSTDEGVVLIDADNVERTLQPGEEIKLDCGVCFSRKVRFKRG